MKKMFVSLLAALSLVSGYAIADEISVLEKETVGIEHQFDFRLRIFRLCISGQEFVQTFAVCPLNRTSSTQLEQIFEEVDGKTVPKKCKHR